MTATDDELLGWIDAIYGLDSNTDQGVTPFVPYYFQAATQLGYPYVKLPHLRKLQKYRGQDRAGVTAAAGTFAHNPALDRDPALDRRFNR